MKTILIAAMLVCCTTAFAASHHSRSSSYGSTHVRHRAYVTKRGTYVAPHVQTAPNRTKVDNWSSKPNVNPYTGKKGSKDPFGGGI